MGLLDRGQNRPSSLRTQTLDWINRQRRAYRCDPLAEIPKGVPNSTIRCPIAIAFEDVFGVGLVMVSPAYLRRAHDLEIITKLPKFVTMFVAVFDDRGYPDLILGHEEDSNPFFLYVPEYWVEDYYLNRLSNRA